MWPAQWWLESCAGSQVSSGGLLLVTQEVPTISWARQYHQLELAVSVPPRYYGQHIRRVTAARFISDPVVMHLPRTFSYLHAYSWGSHWDWPTETSFTTWNLLDQHSCNKKKRKKLRDFLIFNFIGLYNICYWQWRSVYRLGSPQSARSTYARPIWRRGPALTLHLGRGLVLCM